MMDEAEVGRRGEDERAVASAQDSPLFSFIAGQWHRVLQLQVRKGDMKLWELPPEVPLYCLLPRAVSSCLSTHPFSHPTPAPLAERQPDTITKLPFRAGAMLAHIHLSLAQGPTASLGFFQLLRCWFSQYLYVLNYFWKFCLFSPNWLKPANRLGSSEERSGREGGWWQWDIQRGKEVRF